MILSAYDVDRDEFVDQLRALADGIDDESVHLDTIDVASSFGEGDPINHTVTIGYYHTKDMDLPIIDRDALIDH